MQQRARELRIHLHRVDASAGVTFAEKRLWQYLRNGQLDGAQFRKQHAVDTYIVDFFCAKSKLVIEVDGDSHAEQMEYDAARTQWLSEQHQYRVLRFTNHDVLTNIEAVVEMIRARCDGGGPPQLPPSTNSARQGRTRSPPLSNAVAFRSTGEAGRGPTMRHPQNGTFELLHLVCGASSFACQSSAYQIETPADRAEFSMV